LLERRPNAGAAEQAAEPSLLEEQRGAVMVLTLNRPQSRNSLSEDLLARLQAAIDRISSEQDVRAAVIAGNGPAFCAGHDMREMTARRTDPDRGRAYFRDLMDRCAAMMQSIVRSPKPFIAAVEGPASAAGCQLVATCDLAVASEGARFATPGVNIGLFCSTPMVALSRNVSRKHAMEMLLLGEALSAPDAARVGLVNRVVPTGQALTVAMRLAESIASKPGAIVAIGKEAFYSQLEVPLAEAYRQMAEVMTRNMLLPDAEEGIGAFIDKRKPRWTDA
jgi:enoyl-CoA hydratase/carnithine racemase